MQLEDKVETPVPRAKKKLYYGWYIVAVGFLSRISFATSVSSALGVFFKPMSDEFLWPRSYLSAVRSFEAVLSGLVVILIGPFLDKRGARWPMVIGGTVGGLGLILLGRVNDSLQFFLVRGLIVTGGMVGISGITTSVSVSNWFVRKRGRAIGIAGSGFSLGKLIIAPLVTLLLAIMTWREAWGALGLMVLLLVPIPAALVIRRRPEDMGLRPDGAEVSEVSNNAPAALTAGAAVPSNVQVHEPLWSRGEAARTSSFWLIVLTFGVANIGTDGLSLHLIPYLTDVGFSPALAAAGQSILAGFQMVGTIGWGFIIERFPIRNCAVIMFLAKGAAVGVMLWGDSPAVIVVGLCALGFSMSGTGVLQDIIWANYFGRFSLGAVRSASMPFLVIFSALGPIYFGYLYDLTGSYFVSLLGFIATAVIAAGLVFACRPPRRRARPAFERGPAS